MHSGIPYSAIIAALESRGNLPERPPSLATMQKALQRIDDIGDPAHTIVVAGTNGKGTVCATLEALLIHAGQSVGMFTSPHLEDTTERIRLNGRDISRTHFCALYYELTPLVADLQLSHFEMLTLMAAQAFSQMRVKWKIFEVGLGGIWDASNTIPHDFSVITRLGLDHQNLLGTTLPEIAKNKFGIVQHANCVVHTPFDPTLNALAAEVQSRTQSHWHCSPEFRVTSTLSATSTPLKEPTFTLHTSYGSAPLLLPGVRSGENTTTALTLFEHMGFNPSQHLEALSQVRWPCRMEKIDLPEKRIYLSGDHNPDGIQSLIELLAHYEREHLYILFGIGKDKDAEPMLQALFQIPKTSVFLTETPFRTKPLNEYSGWLQRSLGSSPDPKIGLDALLQKSGPNDLILVTGSLYLTGQIRHLLKGMCYKH